jgi:hypothetical protein
MKKERQIGIRVGVPAFFALELEDVYRHTEGAHRALAFPDFVGLLVGLGLEQYRKGNALPEAQKEAPDGEERETPEGDPLHLFDTDRNGLQNLLREFDEAMEEPEPMGYGRSLRLVTLGEMA